MVVSLTTYENTKQKNDNKMKFTFSNLYEAINNTLQELKHVNADNSRISYSVKDSIRVLEAYQKELNSVVYESYIKHNTLSKVNNLSSDPIQNSIKALELQLKELNSIAITEEVENSINPLVKYKVARDLHNGLSVHSWIDPVKNLMSYIGHVFEKNKHFFIVSEAVQKISLQKDVLSEKLAIELTTALKESTGNFTEKFKQIAERNPWSFECKSILNEMKVEESKLIDSKQVKVVKTYSPIVENAKGVYFHLNGKDYVLANNKIEETLVKDQRYLNVLEGLKLFKQNGDTFSIFNNEKAFEFNASNGKITLGDMNLTNESVLNIKNSLLTTNFFGYRDTWKVDTVCRLIESLDILAEMDNFTSLQSQEFLALYLTLINIEESIYINRVNGSMKLNEMIRVSSATEAAKIIKEFINYDITPLMSNRLIKENNQNAIRESQINELNDIISFLENKRMDIKNAIASFGKTSELSEALAIVESELFEKERELSKFYTVEKKKVKRNI